MVDVLDEEGVDGLGDLDLDGGIRAGGVRERVDRDKGLDEHDVSLVGSVLSSYALFWPRYPPGIFLGKKKESLYSHTC